MAETSPASSAQSSSPGQTNAVTHSKKGNKILSAFREFRNDFTKKKLSKDEDHALYQTYERWAESVKITIQMFIGVILVIALLLDVIAYILGLVKGNAFSDFFHSLHPLDIIAYGLFFSTGIDLAYMLYTPGPDEAIDPVMTGLAAAILLGVGKLDFSQIKLEQGVALFLAVIALGGLFATKKFLFHPTDKDKIETKNETQLAKQADEVQK